MIRSFLEGKIGKDIVTNVYEDLQSQSICNKYLSKELLTAREKQLNASLVFIVSG